jgi:glycosyltransferase involved in cell wall biosynthesis
MTLRGLDIVCVGFADWDADLPTNQHHLMRRLARDNRVLFVESLGLRRPQLARRDVARIGRRLRRGLGPPRRDGAVEVLSPLVVPLHGGAAVRALNAGLLRRRVARRVRGLGFSRPVLWAYVPHAGALVDVLRPSHVVYHCVDDIAAQRGVDGPSFRAVEARFLPHADLVLASSPALVQRLRAPARNVVYAPNVADTALFATALEPGAVDGALSRLPHPRIVFTGAVVATKLDVPMLVELARLRPAWTFAFVGPVGPGDPRTDVSALSAEPNVHLLGPRPYERLPDVLRGADAAIIPYALNELTKAVFPMKVYEYLAAGLPVVASELPALAGVEDVVTAGGAAQTAARLDELLAADDPAARRRRSQLAAGHSWERRLDEISAALGL